MTSSYKIGTTFAGMTALSALTTPVVEPNHSWQDFAEEVVMASGKSVGRGFPLASWAFPLFPDVAMRNQLKTFCPGKSAAVYIATQNNAGTFANYSAIMHWPIEEDKENNWDIGLVIKFTRLVAASS